MENAAKALTIAGTILISLLVISAVVFMYRDLTSVKRQDAENQKLQEITDFNKSFESFDKTLSGAKMLSLSNKIKDYNEKYTVRMSEGYKKIELYINGNNNNNGTEWSEYYSELQRKVDTMMNDKYISANYLEALKEAKDVKSNASSLHLDREQADETLKELREKLGNTRFSEAEKEYINDYKIYEQYLKIKKQTFKPAGIEYDERNGRITKMSYTT